MRKLHILLFLFGVSQISFGQENQIELADDLLNHEKLLEAYTKFKEAALLYQEQNAYENYAICNLKMAECRLKMSKPDLAVQLAERTLVYLKEVVPNAPDLLAHAQMIAGESYLNLGRNDLALEHFKEAEQYYEESQSLKTANCYNLLGITYWNTENKTTALFYHEKALILKESLLPTNDPLIADSYNNIGLVYLGDQDLKAILFFDKALKIYQAKFGKTHPKVANCYSNIAFAYSNQKNYPEAISYLDQVMAIWDANFTDDHPNKAFTLSNKGRIMESRGDLNKALHFQQEALQMYVRLYGAKHPEIANTYFLIGTIRQKQSRFLEAVSSYQASIYANLFTQDFETLYDLPELRDYYNADILLTSIQAKAKALEALHFENTLKFRDLNGALLAYELCDDLMIQIRRLRLNEKDKLRLGNIASNVHENGIRIALILSEYTLKKQYFLERAFDFCERSKSAVLLDAIQETKAKSFSGIPVELLNLEDSLRTEIGLLERQLANAKENQEPLKIALFDYQKSYQVFVEHLEEKFPDYYQLKYNQKYTKVPDLQEVLSPTSAILSYFTAEQRIYIFYISKNDFKVFDIKKDAEFIKQTISFRNGIKYNIRTTFETSASALYEQLIPKINPDITHLIILPDGVLGTLPFEALLPSVNAELPFNELNFLVKNYAISYDYAATLLQERLRPKAKEESKGILLVAPVSFEGNDQIMATLPGSETEVKEIKYLFNSTTEPTSVALKKEASEVLIKSDELSGFKYIHFATHGVVNESKPELSRIFLYPTEKEDGSLFSGEIYNLKINAQLVTLSACETGLGKITKGEGIIGLSRSLLYAGAENLIVSLWQVADASTADLMIEFYRQHLHHSQNQLFNDDLRKAKLSLIGSDQFANPYYWAPFILVGQ